jgi:hypothetical protein
MSCLRLSGVGIRQNSQQGALNFNISRVLGVESTKTDRVNDKSGSSKEDILIISLEKISMRGRENREKKREREKKKMGGCGVKAVE